MSDRPNDAAPVNLSQRRQRPPRVPPHDLAAEASLLGAMLLRADAIAAALGVGIDPQAFYKPAHGHIYAACLAVHADDAPVDPVTVADQLHRDGLLEAVGGPPVLVALQTGTPAISNASRYAKIVQEFARLRRLIGVGAEIAELGYSLPDDVDAAEAKAAQLVEHATAAGRPGQDLFHPWTPAELLDDDTEFVWLVKGMYATPTYGMTVGEMKTAKSTVSGLTAMAVAAGLPVLGRFDVDVPVPVVIYVGEGGRIPHTRFLTRVARSLGLDDWRDVPIYPRYETAPLNSDRFQRTLRRDLDTIQPGLVIIDPYYSFHGADNDARNLHDEAVVLNAVSAPVVEAGAVLDIVHHFNRSGGGGLKRITMAGGGEWVDTWRLLSHRKDPDVDHGRFYLRLEIGSRQWGGTTWDLDLNLGRFNPELGIHDGEISFTIGRPDSGPGNSEAAKRIIELVANNPLAYTREDLARQAGIAIAEARILVDNLAIAKKIKPEIVERKDTLGRTQRLWRFHAPTDSQTDHDGPTHEPTETPGQEA